MKTLHSLVREIARPEIPERYALAIRGLEARHIGNVRFRWYPNRLNRNLSMQIGPYGEWYDIYDYTADGWAQEYENLLRGDSFYSESFVDEIPWDRVEVWR